jgi:hypothetical protein
MTELTAKGRAGAEVGAVAAETVETVERQMLAHLSDDEAKLQAFAPLREALEGTGT